MSKSLVTNRFRLNAARQVLESISEAANTQYFVFASKHTPFDTDSVPTPYDTVYDTIVDTYNSMLFGKRVTNSDAVEMIRYVPWVSGKSFDMFDDRDPLLLTKDFYAVVNAGSYHHAWKCLDNAGGANSTVYPDVAQISAEDDSYQTSDGYVWKYMYSVTNANKTKFATTEYFPVYANSSVVENATEGSIDVILVEDAGLGYDNYISGVFSNSDLRILGDPTKFAVNSSASTLNDFYNGCVLYITAGTGIGQHRIVEDYVISGNTKYVVLDSTFDTLPTNGSEYEIMPRVIVVGDGTETIAVEARAVINAVGNSIHAIEVLEQGAGYKTASAYVYADAVVGIPDEEVATLRPIFPPPGGHGADATAELGGHWLGISVKFSNTEANTIPSSNVFRRFGLLKDPLFREVVININGQDGTYIGGELAQVINPKLAGGSVSINTTSVEVVGTGTDFTGQWGSGDLIYFSDGDNEQLTTVNAVTNATHMTLVTEGLFACTSANAYYPNATSYGTVVGVSTGQITMSNLYVMSTISPGEKIIGVTSGAHGTVNNVIRAGEEKYFETFVNMPKYVITPTSGTLEENELVFQGSIDEANAFVHSVNATTLYVSEQVGIFQVGESLIGNTSSAVVEITDKYVPELMFGSGEVIYIENIEPVDRQPNQTETIKLVIEF